MLLRTGELSTALMYTTCPKLKYTTGTHYHGSDDYAYNFITNVITRTVLISLPQSSSSVALCNHKSNYHCLYIYIINANLAVSIRRNCTTHSETREILRFRLQNNCYSTPEGYPRRGLQRYEQAKTTRI